MRTSGSGKVRSMAIATMAAAVLLAAAVPERAAAAPTIAVVVAPRWVVDGRTASLSHNAFFNGVTYVPGALNIAGTTYVPLRFAATLTGQAITYTPASRRISLTAGTPSEPPAGPPTYPSFPTRMSVEPSGVSFSVDGVDRTPNPASYEAGGMTLPLAVNVLGTTYVPIRLLAGLLGVEVSYQPSPATITLTTPSVGILTDPQSVSPGSTLEATATPRGLPGGATPSVVWTITWPGGTVRPALGAGDGLTAAIGVPENAPDGSYILTAQVSAGAVSTSGTTSFTVAGSPPTALVPAQGFAVSDVMDAYDMNALLDSGAQGQGQTIDLFEWGSANTSDLATFDLAMGLPPPVIQTFYFEGGENAAPADETTLDVEWAHAIAPLARINLYIAPKDLTGDFPHRLADAIADAAKNGDHIFSVSYGVKEMLYPEDGTDLIDQAFAADAKAGMAIFASTGDWGPDFNDVWPAADPNVIAVGGTTLTHNSSGAWSETYWNSSNGSGVYGPTSFPQAAWQKPFVTTQGDVRAYPDVSFVADPQTGVAAYWQGAWDEFGGTSVGAPAWAALWADWRSYVSMVTGVPLGGDPPQLIYELAALPDGASLFRSAVSPAPATITYDTRTGLGTPDAWRIAESLATIEQGSLNPH